MVRTFSLLGSSFEAPDLPITLPQELGTFRLSKPELVRWCAWRSSESNDKVESERKCLWSQIVSGYQEAYRCLPRECLLLHGAPFKIHD